MKKLAGLVIILAALVLGGYYSMGILTEKTIRKNIEAIDQSNGLNAQIEQYDRGLFSSEAKVKWTMHLPERVSKDAVGNETILPAQDYNMDTPLTLHHGPIIFTHHKLRFGLGYAESVFPFPKQYEEQFNSVFTKESIKPQLDLSIFVNYFNQSTVDFQVPTFNLFAKQGDGYFEWLGMNATTTMTSEMKKIWGAITVDGMHFTKENTKTDLTKIVADYDLHETLSGLYLGDANFTLPNFNVVAKGQKIFEIVDLVLKSDSDIEQHLFNTHFNLALKSLLANGENYGPGHLEVALKNLDADVLAKINQQASAMQNGTDAQRQQAMIAMLPELPKLLNKSAEFEISKLIFTLPQGQLEGTLRVSLPQNDKANPFELMQKIHGNAKLQAPVAAVKEAMQQSVMQQIAKQPELQKTLVQQLQANQVDPAQATPAMSIKQLAVIQIEKQLNALQQNGLITLKGADYFIEISLDQGKFIVNGKPFDSSMLKF